MTSKNSAQSNTVFEAVANPARRKILDLLKERDQAAGELAAAFPRMLQPAISRHLRVLREADLVDVFPEAQQRIYSLKPKKLREIDVWVSMYREFWSERLDSLATHLNSKKFAPGKRDAQ
jgi:DNA-binding transcriptional ArsR family regulator